VTLVDPVSDQHRAALARADRDQASLAGADRDQAAPARPDHHEAALARAADILTGASSAVLLAHVNPDADALGSALALGLGLAGSGMDVAVSFAEPDAVPQSLSSLPGQHLVVDPDQLPCNPDLVVTLDVGSAGRLGALEGLLEGASRVLVVDHHATNTRFGDDHFVDPSAEATGVLVARLLDALGIEINPDIATNLYAGLATDTVSFRHATAGTHELAARLVDAGARPAELLAPITDLHPFGWLEMLAAVLGRAVLIPGVAAGADFVHTCVTLSDGAGLRQEEVDSVIDIVRTTAPRGVTAVAKQTDSERWQVSLRSSGTTDVSEVARALGGGGHSWAGGFTHHGDYPSAISRILDVLAADPER
jgi:phosphoesterase RecJ-like protein